MGSELDLRVVPGTLTGIRQILNIGVLDQLLGTDSGAKAAVITQVVVDDCQIVGDSDGTLGADLLAQTAADTAHGTGTCGDSALFVIKPPFGGISEGR